VKKIRPASIGKENRERKKKEEKLKKEAKSRTCVANKVLNIRSATLSSSSCGSVTFGAIAQSLTLVPHILLLASKIHVYLDV
jgi:hypothetical protein